ncbi:MAG: DUF502 domain-containing protein [Planctomycetota bacterium]|nr:MAG: DUF502 domain-containing protein [Planctomycetota bacterium]REJ87257.1 MAG: DUF502 domain-containing protein [Planctomycetota bacterium]REK31561.1 MAG: DUF502 domain-containing protein [Planctomycetota bacterium]REK43101.1 MAG: DUF502 domain-containing protein [Planctomycetota bacterium]
MRRAMLWLWRHGIVATFMTGLFVVLPIVVTLAIIGWVASILVAWLGPSSPFGSALRFVGLGLLSKETSAWLGTLLGWLIVIFGIWFVGVVVRAAARQQLEQAFHGLVERIPVINAIYKPVSQVVGMLKQDDTSQMQGMSVVYCDFGERHGGGFLALLASEKTFQFAARQCYAVYIPTSPLPMSGGIVFVPVEKVTVLEMSVDELMQIYFSLGVMAPKVVPAEYQAGVA